MIFNLQAEKITGFFYSPSCKELGSQHYGSINPFIILETLLLQQVSNLNKGDKRC